MFAIIMDRQPALVLYILISAVCRHIFWKVSGHNVCSKAQELIKKRVHPGRPLFITPILYPWI